MPELTPQKKQRFAQHFMVAGIRQGLSSNNILDQLQAVGLGYRRRVFLQDMKRLRRFKPRMPRLTAKEKTTYLSSARTLGMLSRGKTKYQYVFDVPTYDPISHKYIEHKNVSFISSRELIPDVAFSLAPYTIALSGSPLREIKWDNVDNLTQVVWQPGKESYE